MYSYTYDEKTGGIILNSTPTNFSKEPRPVYAPELDLLGFDKYWEYDKQADIPYMWAESVQYIYRGKVVARLKGGDIFNAPEIILQQDENGNTILPEPKGKKLKPIDVEGMISANAELLEYIENYTIKKILAVYEKRKKSLDIFHVAFSGGKDSAVLLDLVKKALPQKSFVVVFGDTGMEFPDTKKLVNNVKANCEKEGIPFYISHSHFDPEESWHLFGPPARVLRWCCSVHKSTPQTLTLREITGKNDYVGLDYVGVRKHESTARSEYEYENYGKKQKGQYSHNSILEWTSAEIWLYIISHDLPINEAYKKGNSRAGCLLCPMGGGRSDYIQRKCYPEEVQKYMNLVFEMNSRDKGNEKALNSYIANGGWNARKNGRDLTISDQRYKEEVKNGKLIITLNNPRSDWKEWIKTLGDISFNYNIEEKEKTVLITLDSSIQKKNPTECKRFKQVFHKAACCVGCRVCETNCKNGCISFKYGVVKIDNCLHCGQCHEIDDGCLLFHSLRTGNGEGKMKVSVNSFASHAPKTEWVRDFFDLGNGFWEDNSLGKNQVPMFKRFLRDSGLIDKNGDCTELFEIHKSIGWDSNLLWGIMLSNLAYNPQIQWYIKNMDVGAFYERSYISELLTSEGVSQNDASAIIGAFKRFCELPMGNVLNWGSVFESGNKIDSLSRNQCIITDNLVVLYSLLLFSEKCNDYKEFTLSWLLNDSVERDGVSPSRIFGIDYESMKSILLGLSAKYPDFIDATFTNDLEKISIKGMKSTDVIKLIGGEI
ncbi:MAG: phosphoadenosine phosphosulfate reductase family protein [Clostridia bacterium]|nr:phosphoadenosine phosphosulfate reductase family protein [Clostridia bacterium]